MSSRNFYAELKSFSRFSDFTCDEHFCRVPEDWYVVITDVKGSTKAIEAGRYKDVNTIGAASVSIVSELLDEDVPFVFGGDGATLLIPSAYIERVIEGLKGLQRLSKNNFQIDLRVGRIQVAEVYKTGATIEVAKHELIAGRCLAVFRGGGLTEAEKCIKGKEHIYCCEPGEGEGAELTGLSCRWNPLTNKRGKIMSLLVSARTSQPARVYTQFLDFLTSLYEGRLDEANPINTELLRYHSVAECVRDETRFHPRRSTLGFLKRIFEIVMAVLVFKFNIPPLLFNARHYLNSMGLHADHRKFDDMLRMILDCSAAQAEAIREYLEERHAAGELCYGIHLSETALMTCYVQDVKDGQHIHFVDGGDGGYAMAARQLKAQLKALKD